jgi:hypothetical protein
MSKTLAEALREARDLLADLDQGRGIHNSRFPDSRIDGPLWAQVSRVTGNATAALAAGVATPKVKALEWEQRDGEWIARPTSGPAYLLRRFHKEWDLLINGVYVKPYIAGFRETYELETGKAAAQADYERRILSALDIPSPPTGA